MKIEAIEKLAYPSRSPHGQAGHVGTDGAEGGADITAQRNRSAGDGGDDADRQHGILHCAYPFAVLQDALDVGLR